MKLNTYLNFKGDCEAAFDFYAAVFGVEPVSKMRHSEGPSDYVPAAGDERKIMHIALPIGDNLLMGSDMPAAYESYAVTGDTFSVSIGLTDRDEADRLFTALSEGGTVEMPMQSMFWGSYFGMFKDRYGVKWMIDCNS